MAVITPAPQSHVTEPPSLGEALGRGWGDHTCRMQSEISNGGKHGAGGTTPWPGGGHSPLSFWVLLRKLCTPPPKDPSREHTKR